MIEVWYDIEANHLWLCYEDPEARVATQYGDRCVVVSVVKELLECSGLVKIGYL